MLDQIAALPEGLRNRAEIDAAIPVMLEEQIADVRDDPENVLSRRGLLESANNALGTMAEAVLKAGGWAAGEVRDVAGRYWREVKDHGSKTAARWTVRVGTAVAFREFFTANAPRLRALAQASPDEFGWLLNFLQLIGL